MSTCNCLDNVTFGSGVVAEVGLALAAAATRAGAVDEVLDDQGRGAIGGQVGERQAARSIARTLATERSGRRSVAKSVTRDGSRGWSRPSRASSRPRTRWPGWSAPGDAPRRGTSGPAARPSRPPTWRPGWRARPSSAGSAAGPAAPAGCRAARCSACSCTCPAMSGGRAAIPGPPRRRGSSRLARRRTHQPTRHARRSWIRCQAVSGRAARGPASMAGAAPGGRPLEVRADVAARGLGYSRRGASR